MLSDWCEGVGYDTGRREFGLLVKDKEGLAIFSWGFSGEMMRKVRHFKKPLLDFSPGYTATILPIHLCKWETEE